VGQSTSEAIKGLRVYRSTDNAFVL